MALPIPRPLTEVVVGAYLADISTAGSAFAVSPCKGRIVRVYSVIYGAITVGDAVWTVEIDTVAVTGISVTVANASSAAGDVDTDEPTVLSTSLVREGSTIEFVNAAGSTGTVPVMFYAVIERD